MNNIYKILIVEDNEDDRMVYRRILKTDYAHQWSILEAESAEDALGKYGSEGIDVVLLDYNLPDRNGLSALKNIKKINPYVAAIMVTGQGNEFVASQAIKNGALDYVIKQQISSTLLQSTISRALRKMQEQKHDDHEKKSLQKHIQVLSNHLKGPLCNIIGATSLVHEAAIERNIEAIYQHNLNVKDAALGIVDAIAELNHYASIVPQNKHQEVSLLDVVNEVIHSLRTQILERSAVVTADREWPKLRISASDLELLFEKLIHNALKYCKNVIPRVHIGIEDNVAHWLFSVTDNGQGIAAKNYARIFTNKESPHEKGDHLVWSSLATCKKIVKRHGGDIWCASKIGEGSTFYVSLPKK